MILENRDTAVLGVHINDNTAVLIRIRGLENILNEVIETDEHNIDEAPTTSHPWPNEGDVGPNHFTRLLAEKVTGAQFEYSIGE